MTGPINVLPGIAAKALDWRFSVSKTVVPRQVWFCGSYQMQPDARKLRLHTP